MSISIENAQIIGASLERGDRYRLSVVLDIKLGTGSVGFFVPLDKFEKFFDMLEEDSLSAVINKPIIAKMDGQLITNIGHFLKRDNWLLET